jgi:hypothetical protein
MIKLTRCFLLFPLLLGMLLITGCETVTVRDSHPGKGYGPPPHAPAHGYRHKTRRGAELVFDSGLGVYIVVGLPDHYYSDGRYYRYHRGYWEYSPDLDGPWHGRDKKKLPPGLSKKYDGEHPGKGKGRYK